jgi:hypothetical protein
MSSSETLALLGVTMEVCSDDAAFLEEFVMIFGGREAPSTDRRGFLSVHLEIDSGREGYGRLRISGDGLSDPAGFLLGFSSPTVPLRLLDPPDTESIALGLASDPEPVFLFRADECLFRRVPRWRRIVSHFLFLRMLRLRPDALFFHAASVAIAGRGALLLGPKGAGKSTTALALAARGHEFLGDETACYLPASGEILPFRRPVGIKPGPTSATVRDALARLRPAPDEEGLVRVPIESLLPVSPARPTPLKTLVFLSGFGPTPELIPCRAGREELACLQPIASTLTNIPATQRVFEMVRLVGSLASFRLVAADPDETARILEKELRS